MSWPGAWQAAANVGVVMSVEAHLGSIIPTPQAARRLLDLVPGLTLTLDYTHFTYQGIPDAEVEPLMERGHPTFTLAAPAREKFNRP